MDTKQRTGAGSGVGPERPMSLVVIEAGAHWPAFLTRERLVPDCDVLVQQADESFAALKRRVIARIRMLTSEGRSVRLGVMATSTRDSEQAMECRYRIARAIVVARAAQSAELVLVAGEASPRDDLFALAAALCADLAGTDFVVRLRSARESDSGSRSRAA